MAENQSKKDLPAGALAGLYSAKVVTGSAYGNGVNLTPCPGNGNAALSPLRAPVGSFYAGGNTTVAGGGAANG